MVGEGRERPAVATEVVGFRSGRTLLMPLGELHGIGPGTPVHPTGAPFRVAVGDSLLGRVIDGLGAPLDGLEPPERRVALDDRAGARRAHPPTDHRACRTRRPRARHARPRAVAASASASSPAPASASRR